MCILNGGFNEDERGNCTFIGHDKTDIDKADWKIQD